MQVDTLARAAVGALEDIKARDIVVLDVRKLTSLFDTVIVASADSARQTKALSRHVQDEAKASGGDVYGVEGEETGEWVLVDLGDVVVHIMQPAVRDYYNLEELWGGRRPAFGRPPLAGDPDALAASRQTSIGFSS
ncbi:MAG: ribosome silencing factor [Betaproteobacteria bacterium]|nr:ribosome silencing factor [Betaproteobacteria bacterium]